MLFSVLTACNKGSSGGAPDPENLTFGVTVSMISGYYTAMINAIEAKAAEMGIELVLLVADDDSTKQNQQMENFIAQKVDAIICNPVDGTAISSAVQMAMDAGIPVITVDRLAEEATPSKQIKGDAYGLSRDIMEWYAQSDEAKNLGRPTRTLVLVGQMSDSYAVDCLRAHREVIDENPDVFELVAEIPGEWNQDIILTGVQNALSANPDIDLIVSPSDFYIPPVRSALSQLNRWVTHSEPGHVYLMSNDGDVEGMQGVKDGYLLADGVVDARACGEWGVEYAFKVVMGEAENDGEVLSFPCFVVPYTRFDELAPSVYSYSELS